MRPLGDRAFWDLHVEGRLEIGEVQNYEQEMVDFGVAMRKMRSQMRVAVLEENCCGFDVGRALMHAHTTIALRRHGDLVRVQTAANALEAWQGGDFGGAFPQGFTHMLPNMTWQMPPHLVNEILGEMSGKFVLPVVWEAATKADDWAATVDSNSNATVVIGAELSEDKTRLLLHGELRHDRAQSDSGRARSGGSCAIAAHRQGQRENAADARRGGVSSGAASVTRAWWRGGGGERVHQHPSAANTVRGRRGRSGPES